VFYPEFVEYPQCLSREPTQLWVVPFRLKLADDHQRQDDLVLGEAAERPRVRQQDGGVEDEGPQLLGSRGAPDGNRVLAALPLHE